jgi:hypothetical protein
MHAGHVGTSIVGCSAVIGLMLTGVAGQSQPPDFDAMRLQQGTFGYRTVVDGKAAGESRIEVRLLKESGHYRFANLITGAFSQRWEATSTRRFEPVSASLVFGEGADTRPIFELTYRNHRVTGTALMRRVEPPARRTVDDPVDSDTIDQRIDWAAVMSLSDLTDGQSAEFRVYDPETGNSRVSVAIGGTAMTTVPAGTFETARVSYRIEKNRGAETYVALVNKSIPRFLVHETFPNGSTTELVSRR